MTSHSSSVETEVMESLTDDAKQSKDPQEDHDQQAKLIGEIGTWQLLHCSVGAIFHAMGAWIILGNKFITQKVDYWCHKQGQYLDSSLEDWLNISSPFRQDGKFDRCHMFDLDYHSSKSLVRPGEDTPVIPCTAWEYDDSQFQVSFDLLKTDAQKMRLGKKSIFVQNFLKFSQQIVVKPS